MTEHELHELQRIEDMPVAEVTPGDWATYQRLQAKRGREARERDADEVRMVRHEDTLSTHRTKTHVRYTWKTPL